MIVHGCARVSQRCSRTGHPTQIAFVDYLFPYEHCVFHAVTDVLPRHPAVQEENP
jgi:hypothetical protein